MGTSTSDFCDNCGAANEPQATSCCFCGRPLQEAKPTLSGAATGSVLGDVVLKERYRIIAPVGQGGMGTVYRARDIELSNRQVAIKEMNLSGLGPQETKDAAEAFKREATMLADLQHSNLPSVFDYFEEDGRWYLVLSFIQGETLDDYLSRAKGGKLSLDEVLQMSMHLCAVLNYLHSQYPPIIFRDLKPANIMRTSDGQIYLIDFGVARHFKPGQAKDTVSYGSMGYAPPEQFGKTQTTPRSDIYSLGATMYQLLSGHDPDSTPFRFPPLRSLEPAVPVKLAELITQMLEMDEKDRPANMLIVEQRLGEIATSSAPTWPLTTLTSPAASALPLSPSLPPVKKQRRAASVIGMLFLIICSVVGGTSFGNTMGTSSANAQMNTTATATTAQATATATEQVSVIDATATTLAMLPDPYLYQGTLALADPLNWANTWQESTNTGWGGQCRFLGVGYQISESVDGHFYNCNESNVYQNFVFEVKMTVDQGDCGGLLLRESTDDSKFYFFNVCRDGTYNLYKYVSNSDSDSTMFKSASSSAIKLGSQLNTIAVVANGSHFDLYVNEQKIVSISDGSYSQGTIGLVAADSSQATTVTYQDVRIWTIQ